MKIAYGIMGYGQGHAMRSSAVLPELIKQHEVTVFAGRDAYTSLKGRFDCVEIPGIAWQYGNAGKINAARTVAYNLAPISDWLFDGPGTQLMLDEFNRSRPDIVISDSEAWTHKLARRLEIPRISFDHVGVIAYCHLPLAGTDWLQGRRDGLGYRALMGVPERILISSFFTAAPKVPGVELCGPVLRPEVLTTSPSNSGHLLAYFNKGTHQFGPRLESALHALDTPIKVYGTGRIGQDCKLEFKAPSQDGFIRDLAACSALISTAGNQLISEAIYFGKPMFLLPEDCFEQRLNAAMMRRMGFGRTGLLTAPNRDEINAFLDTLWVYEQRLQGQFCDGRQEAIAHLERFIDELRPTRPRGRIFTLPSAGQRRVAVGAR